METITRLVADSLARHGFDRQVDPRRLQWSRWFRCESTHSLLVVPSKPGIFALAEAVAELGPVTAEGISDGAILGGAALQRCDSPQLVNPALAAEVPTRRMLAVLQFSEDDDMAFTLDRMFTCANPMRARLASGRCFLRFVVIEDQAQRRNICNALNQWMLSSAEKATGIAADFQSSLELTVERAPSPASADSTSGPVGRTLLSDSADIVPAPAQGDQSSREIDPVQAAAHLDSGANKNLHCPHPLPSGF